MIPTAPSDMEKARVLRLAVTKQNWKNGGVLVVDTDEADSPIAAALAEERAGMKDKCAGVPDKQALESYHEMIESKEPGRSSWAEIMRRYERIAAAIRALKP